MDRLIGRCIYCGATENLTDEHVMPYALGGTDVLRDSSCTECAKVTGDTERRALNVSWKGLRWVTGMPTRHKKPQPATMPAEVLRGGAWLEVDLPITEYTGAAGFPVFPEPAVLHQGQPDDLIVQSIFTLTGVAGGVDPSISPAKRAAATSYRVPVLYDPKAIARMVAKIAHGYTVDLFGLDAFEPYLPSAILGQTDDIGRWVGTPGGSLFSDQPGRGHRIRVGTYEETVGIIAGVQFFADAGTPEYLIVVGELHTPPSPSGPEPAAGAVPAVAPRGRVASGGIAGPEPRLAGDVEPVAVVARHPGASRVSSRTRTSTARCATADRRAQALGSRGGVGRAATGTPSGQPPRARLQALPPAPP